MSSLLLFSQFLTFVFYFEHTSILLFFVNFVNIFVCKYEFLFTFINIDKKRTQKTYFFRFLRPFFVIFMYYLFLVAELYRCDIVRLLEKSVEMLYILISNGQCNIFNGHAAAL